MRILKHFVKIKVVKGMFWSGSRIECRNRDKIKRRLKSLMKIVKLSAFYLPGCGLDCIIENSVIKSAAN